MTHASLFSGIGGCEVAAAMLGWENLFHCEINPFGRAVLDYWFPNSESYEDITKTNFSKWGGRVDVLTGGFPCQPFSYAGQRRGAEDDRYLWPQMLRAIQECKPTWVIGENVGGITTMVEQGEVVEVGNQTSLFGETDDLHTYEMRQRFTLERVCSDLESVGYEVQPLLIPACAVGAPHRRDRVFIIGHLVADSDCCHDRRVSRDDASESGAQRVQERNAVRKPGESSEIRRESSSDAPSDTNGRGEGASRESGCAQGVGSHANQFESERLGSAERDSRLSAVLRPSQDSVRLGCEGRDGVGQHSSLIGNAGAASHDGKVRQVVADMPSESGEPTDEREDGISQQEQSRGRGGKDGARPHSDSDGSLLEGRNGFRSPSSQPRPRVESLGEEERGDSRDDFGLGRRWQHFPSVSPIHRGNDGIPFDVDGLSIPFNKWRQEALKAYGNAIVPQVMYEIFRAIEEVEQSKSA